MRYAECQNFFKLYVDNPDNIKMLIQLNSEGKIYGRALLWYDELGNKIMDRIYGNDLTVEKFRKWAIKEGYYYKVSNDNRNISKFRGPDGRYYYKFFKIKLKIERYSNYPYMDTFSNINHKFDYVTNGQPLRFITLKSTNGSSSYENNAGLSSTRDSYVCEIFDNMTILREKSIYFEDIGYVKKSNTVICNHSEKPIIKELAVLASDKKWYDRDFTVVTYEDTYVYVNNPKLCKTEDGIYTLIKNTFICSKDGKRYHIKDKVIGKNKKPVYINNII